jgi:copper chaperone
VTTEFIVPDASCGHCKETIEAAIGRVAGVTSVQLDLETKRLKIEHDGSADNGLLASAVTSAGYAPEPV